MKVEIHVRTKHDGTSPTVDPQTLAFTPSPTPIGHVVSYLLDVEDAANLERLKKALTVAVVGWNSTL